MTHDPRVSGELASMLGEADVRTLFRLYGNEMPERTAQLLAAVASCDFEQVRRLAHRLKGSASQYGFSALENSAAILEALASGAADAKKIDSAARDVVES
jgi:HPt (histidine-containing phosphotransfer) domain-containing protein